MANTSIAVAYRANKKSRLEISKLCLTLLNHKSYFYHPIFHHTSHKITQKIQNCVYTLESQKLMLGHSRNLLVKNYVHENDPLTTKMTPWQKAITRTSTFTLHYTFTFHITYSHYLLHIHIHITHSHYISHIHITYYTFHTFHITHNTLQNYVQENDPLTHKNDPLTKRLY